MWIWDDSFIDCERRASAFTSGGLKEEAGSDLNNAFDDADCDPDTVLEMYHYTNGTFLELNGFLEDAIYEFREAVSINPKDAFYRYNLGVSLLKNGQFNEAYKELTEALRLDPDNFEARCALGDVHFEIGRSLEIEGRVEAAEEEYREAISMDPEYPEYYACLGRVLLETARRAANAADASRKTIADAIRQLRSALALDQDCLDARLNLGVALTMYGSAQMLDEGMSMLRSVLMADPLNEKARSSLDDALKLKSRSACTT